MPKREPMSKRGELIARAKEAVLRIRTFGRADGPLLELVLAAVLAETSRNRFPIAALVAALTAEFPEVRAAVSALAADPRAHVRRRALRCLGHDTPRAFAAEILGARLADTEKAVRMKAVTTAYFLQLTELVEDLARYHSTFPAESSASDLPLLRDGYLLEDRGGDNLVLRVLLGRGAKACRQLTHRELADRGIPALVAELRGGG
jgi:hypothetical protein